MWPGGGITVMVDVMQLPRNAFGYVPTPALVAPIEFTLRKDDYQSLGGHMDSIVDLSALKESVDRCVEVDTRQRWPMNKNHFHW